MQTGRRAGAVSLLLEETGKRLLRERVQKEAADGLPELAFYGGTFTAQDEEDLGACLDFGRYWLDQGFVSGLRCSTRPDAVSPEILKRLRKNGFTMVELGIQSFSDRALKAAGRGYDGETALQACRMVQKAGLDLGVQLMPGMPGTDLETARADVLITAGLQPDCARLYPCLVLEGSGLAALWRKGLFNPLEERDSLDLLAFACLNLWKAGTRVIRMGLAPEDGLDGAILAGPRHPSMGGRARGLALYMLIAEQMEALFALRAQNTNGTKANSPALARPCRASLTVPRRYQGEFWGFRKELQPGYAALGLAPESVTWGNGAEFILRV